MLVPPGVLPLPHLTDSHLTILKESDTWSDTTISEKIVATESAPYGKIIPHVPIPMLKKKIVFMVIKFFLNS